MEFKKISHVKVKPDMKVDDLIKEMRNGAGFGARNLSQSVEIFCEMIKDEDCTIFLGLAGAMVPGGMRQVIIDLIEQGYIDVLVCTGATLTHDIIEAYGHQHLLGSAYVDDKVLAEKNLNRIYNVFLPNDAYEMFEDNIQSILNEIKKEKIGAQEFLHELGLKLNKNSIITTAAKKEVPIFCPGLLDSILGFQIWMFSQTHNLFIDSFDDQRVMLDIAYDSKKRGALIVGGGVPKHFIALAMQHNGNNWAKYDINKGWIKTFEKVFSGSSYAPHCTFGFWDDSYHIFDAYSANPPNNIMVADSPAPNFESYRPYSFTYLDHYIGESLNWTNTLPRTYTFDNNHAWLLIDEKATWNSKYIEYIPREVPEENW